MAFFHSFLQYFVTMILLAAVALAGTFTGKKLCEVKTMKH